MNPQWQGKGHRGAVEGEGRGGPLGEGSQAPVSGGKGLHSQVFSHLNKGLLGMCRLSIELNREVAISCYSLLLTHSGFEFLFPAAGRLLPCAGWVWAKKEDLSRRFVLLATRLSTMRKASLRGGGASTRDASSARLAGI